MTADNVEYSRSPAVIDRRTLSNLVLLLERYAE